MTNVTSTLNGIDYEFYQNTSSLDDYTGGINYVNTDVKC